MSIATTHWVERDFAIRAIQIKHRERIERLEKQMLDVHTMTNQGIGDVLDHAIDNDFYNFLVVDKLSGTEMFTVTDLNSLP